MKASIVLGALVVTQVVLLLFVLFGAPVPVGHLKLAQDEMQSGKFLSIPTRVTAAINGYEFQTRIVLSVTILMLLLSLVLVMSLRRMKGATTTPPKTEEP